MFSKLLPSNTSFFDFFERHAALTVQGCQQFVDLTRGGDIEKLAKRIKEIEHETDVITHGCVEALHKTFITPIERDDIHRLITRMDDVMDYVEAASERIALYEITTMTTEIQEMARVLVESSQEVESALKGLRNMKNARDILRKCIDINRLENEADSILRNAVARLFKEEKDPITVIKWKEIYENVENATDRCEDVANIIEGVVLEHA
jgi:predicted phosphate transport protein (TIGR00153 family)